MGRKKKKKTLLQRIYKYRRLYVLIIIIIGIAYLAYYLLSSKTTEINALEVIDSISLEIENSSESLSSRYTVDEETEDENLIEGQTIAEDADGYTTTFTCSNEVYPKTYIEYKQNLGSWAENSYWGGTMSENGCGITAIAIIASGYGSSSTPETLREKYFPHLESSDIEKAFNKLGLRCTEFCFDSTYLSEKYITNWLSSGRPILVCLDSTKDNVWTEASHYMALLDVNEEGLIYVSNPNGLDDTEKASGWYETDDVLPYIAKAMFIESYE